MNIWLYLVSENVGGQPCQGELTLTQDPEYRRLKSSVNIGHALYLFNTDRSAITCLLIMFLFTEMSGYV